MAETETSARVRWSEVDGVGFVRAIGEGRADPAPHAELLDYRIVDVRPGWVALAWEVPDALLNPAGIAHGGFLVALLDDAAGLAAASRYPRFVPQLTLELRSDFIAPVRPEVTHRVVGEVVRGGRSSTLADARVVDADGAVLARTSGTFLPNRQAIPEHRWAEAGIVPRTAGTG